MDIPCIWEDNEQPYPDDDDDIEGDDEAYEAWLDDQPKRYPELSGEYHDQWDTVQKTVSLHGRTLQVIVKLANIVLTPEQPEYEGGRYAVNMILRA